MRLSPPDSWETMDRTFGPVWSSLARGRAPLIFLCWTSKSNIVAGTTSKSKLSKGAVGSLYKST